jgi:hypothetical protein
MIDSSDRTSRRLLDSIRKAKAGETNADTATAGETHPTPSTAEPTPPSAPLARRTLSQTAPVTPAATKPPLASQSTSRASSATRRTASAAGPRVRNAATTAQDPHDDSGRRQSVADPGATTEKKGTDRSSGRVWPD